MCGKHKIIYITVRTTNIFGLGLALNGGGEDVTKLSSLLRCRCSDATMTIFVRDLVVTLRIYYYFGEKSFYETSGELSIKITSLKTPSQRT